MFKDDKLVVLHCKIVLKTVDTYLIIMYNYIINMEIELQ